MGRIVEEGRPEDVLTGLTTELDSAGTESVVRARVVGRREGLLCLMRSSFLDGIVSKQGKQRHRRSKFRDYFGLNRRRESP